MSQQMKMRHQVADIVQAVQSRPWLLFICKLIGFPAIFAIAVLIFAFLKYPRAFLSEEQALVIAFALPIPYILAGLSAWRLLSRHRTFSVAKLMLSRRRNCRIFAIASFCGAAMFHLSMIFHRESLLAPAITSAIAHGLSMFYLVLYINALHHYGHNPRRSAMWIGLVYAGCSGLYQIPALLICPPDWLYGAYGLPVP